MNRVLAIILLVLAARTAAAQIETPDEPTVFADFGFAGTMPTGCWAPITVAVQAIDEPLSGYVELSYIAGGEQINHVTPFAVAAQSNALIPMTVHLPWWTDTVSVAAFDEQQGRVAQLEYRTSPGPTDARLPTLSRPEGIVISVTPRLPAGLAVEAMLPLEDDQAAKPRRLSAVNLTPERLPPNHLAYDGVDLLVVEPASFRGADPRAIEAILRWTASGGRLLVLADRPGSEYARWLNATPATAAIDVGTITTTDTGTGRPLTLSPVATAAGWGVVATNASNQAVAVTGPFAFGSMSLFTIDPLDAPGTLRTLLAPSSADTTDDLVASIDASSRNWYDPFARRTSDQVLYRYIDAVASSDPPGSGGFILIAAVPLALALLLGPIDYILLGALRRRPLAWLSAFIWIGAVGTVAFTAPRLFQNGDADIGSVSATDLILPNLAMPMNSTPNAAARIPPHLAGWSAEATLLFHASQSPFTLEAEAPLAWRPFESGGGDAVALAGITFRQTPAGPGTNAPAGIEPLRIPARIWSMVTLHAEGPTPPPFAVALAAIDGQLTAQLTGLSEASSVIAARVLHNEQAYALVTLPPAPTNAQLRFTPTANTDAAFDPGNTARQAFAAFALLAGEPTRRNDAIATLQNAGWARLDLLIENPPTAATFTTPDPATRTRYTHYRILTPMPNNASETMP